MKDGARLRIAVADSDLRRRIYRVRHEIFASELGQHHEDPRGLLSDRIDDFNTYIAATRGDEIAGFVSVTPPGHGYSFEKYIDCRALPFSCDDGLYEIRLLSVVREHRRSLTAGFLMYSALHWIGARGGRTVAALGRQEVLDLYLRVGLIRHDIRVQAGSVAYVLLANTVAAMFRHIAADPYLSWIVDRLRSTVDWSPDGHPC